MIERENIHKHIDILQGIISRMASSSSNCKGYCISLVTGLLALDQIKVDANLHKIAFLPILAFGFLDCYYLYLERFFRNQYNDFIKQYHEGTLNPKEIFVIKPPQRKFDTVMDALSEMFSLSIAPFYGFLIILVFILTYVVK